MSHDKLDAIRRYASFELNLRSRTSHHYFELGNLFACTAAGAPEAEELVQFGLQEGPLIPNTAAGFFHLFLCSE